MTFVFYFYFIFLKCTQLSNQHGNTKSLSILRGIPADTIICAYLSPLHKTVSYVIIMHIFLHT